jgi:hypothetical protein
MIAAVARRETPASPTSAVTTSGSTAHDHVALDEATRRWLSEGDTPDNVAAYASALRDLLRTPSR